MYLIGIEWLFGIVSTRIDQATKESRDLYMEDSVVWGERKGRSGANNFIDSEPDCSNKNIT